jgi:hypothetical protein
LILFSRFGRRGLWLPGHNPGFNWCPPELFAVNLNRDA